MTDNEVSCFTTIRKALLKWRFNGNTKIIRGKSDKSIDRSDTKIQLLLYNNNNNNVYSPSTTKITINSDSSTINVPILFHADMELSQSQSEQQPNCSSNSSVNRDKARQEIEFKEHKSVSIEIGSSSNSNNKHSIIREFQGVVLREKRHKRDENMDYNETSDHRCNDEQMNQCQSKTKPKPRPLFHIGSDTSSIKDMRYYASEEEMETDDILSPLPVDTNQYFVGNRSAGTKTSTKFKFPQSAPAMESSRLNKLRFNFDFDCSHTLADNIKDYDDDEKPLTDIKFPSLLPPNPPLRILYVFHKNDAVIEAFLNACHRLNVEPTLAKSTETAIDIFQNITTGGHHIIAVDSRCPKQIDAESFGRSIRNMKGSQHTIMVAIIKKGAFDKDDTLILSYLDAGYNRCIVESPHVSCCSSELRQIMHSLVRPQNVISTQQALYMALHRAKEAILITDDTLRTQYANKATERLLNMKLDEILSRPLSELTTSDVSGLLAQTNRFREYDGLITLSRKSQTESITVHVKAAPITCVGRSPTHLVIVLDSQASADAKDTLQMVPQAKEAPRGSLHSIRRCSFDIRSVASDGLRRTSLAKLSSLPLEAPITKVVNILTQVQENCSQEESKLLDRAMEFLKREGLYSPQMKEICPQDPVATDLIGALLTQGPTNVLSSRRSSNDSIIRSGRQSASSGSANKTKVPTQLSELMETALEWDFEIFKLEDMTEKRPLVYLGLELCRRFDVFTTFNCDETTFKSWLIVIEAHYHSANTYHNSTHAADVMQATACYLQQLSMRESKLMDEMDEATALIAAATHDIDHPGRSSAFLCNSGNPLSLLYNDICVLESHHAATTFRLTLSDEKINIFKNLDRETYKLARQIIIDMILATEMTRHFEHLAKFVSVFGTDVETKDFQPNDVDDNQILVRRMMIKCADVSNPTRPLKFCVEWSRRIAEEYFTQTDEEKRRGLPIVMPMFDRTTCSISKSQIGFIEYIIQDMMNAWDGFIDMPEIIQYMQFNYTQWKLYEEQGIKTLSDIKRKQMSITSNTLSQQMLEEML